MNAGDDFLRPPPQLPADDDSFPKLVPLDPDVESARKKIRETERPATRNFELPQPVAAPKLQFGLLHLLLANTALAIVLALLQVLAPDLTAATLGIAAFAMLLWEAVYQPTDPRLRTIGYLLLSFYVIVSLIAFIRLMG